MTTPAIESDSLRVAFTEANILISLVIAYDLWLLSRIPNR